MRPYQTHSAPQEDAMKFEMPESLDGLEIAKIDELHRAAWEELTTITAKDDADVTAEEIEDLDKLQAALDTLETAKGAIELAAQERADKLAAARGRTAPADAEATENAEEGAEPEGEGDEGDPDAEPDGGADAEAEPEKEKELVTASARMRTVRSATRKAPDPAEVIPAGEDESPRNVLIAAAGIQAKDGRFEDLSVASAAWQSMVSKSPAAAGKVARGDFSDLKPVMKLSEKSVRQGFLQIEKPAGAFELDESASVAEQLRIIDEAADERKRFGSDGLARTALTAAGGWCAPSETLYDFCSYETVSGILDIPTVTIRRGGINFTKGPDYATLAATWGFTQTEAQAEAGTEKDCYAVECPPFAETRLDAVGYCVTAGVLTASPAGYPELIRRVLEIGTVAHAHKVNASVISRIQTIIGAATNYAEVGSATADILQALEIAALRLRYSLAMAENATVEVVLPIWAKGLIRADLSRRTGVDMLAVGDAEINRWLGARGVRAQFVYDYQPFATGNTGTWTAFPTALEFMMWPAGAFIKGTSPVIDLDTIYDSVGLSTNTFTAAFFEEGLLVANRCGFGVRYALTLSGLSGLTGLTGAAALGGGAGITYPSA
jgi:hypothetical protein